jgi:hypothetical protein
VGFLLVVETQICENLEGRLKVPIATFKHHWRIEEVGSEAHSFLFLIFFHVL